MKEAGVVEHESVRGKGSRVVGHLAERYLLSANAHLASVHSHVVKRLKGKIGLHGESFHDVQVQKPDVVVLEADERHGYAQDKSQAQWEAEVIDLMSKFVVSQVQAQRDKALPTDRYFEGVLGRVWGFLVGDYQVLTKRLKDRCEWKLNYDDIRHCQ